MNYATAATSEMLFEAVNREMHARVEIQALRAQIAEHEAKIATLSEPKPDDDQGAMRERILREENRQLVAQNEGLQKLFEGRPMKKEPPK